MYTAQETTQDDAMTVLSPQTCVTALNKSMILGRKALQTELAICLAIFAGAGSTNREVRSLLTDLYCKAGYEASDTKSRHYKAVNRKVSAAASLYENIGGLAILHWVGNAQEDEVIDAVMRGLEAYQFESMDDVLQFTGRPSNRNHAGGRPKEKVKELIDQPLMKFNAGKIHVEVPRDASSQELIKMAGKLLRVARVKEQQELQTPLGRVSSIEKPVPLRNLH